MSHDKEISAEVDNFVIVNEFIIEFHLFFTHPVISYNFNINKHKMYTR